MSRHIVTLGGGGFHNGEDAPTLNQFILNLSGRPNPKVCLIPTASGDLQEFMDRFDRTFSQLECRPFHLSFFKAPQPDWRAHLADCDVIYVTGGNTRAMLAIWREWGLDQIIRQAYERGVVLAGGSAGAICWFEQGHTDSNGLPLSPLNCLGWLKGSCSPHYNGEPARRPSYLQFVGDGTLSDGYAIEDGVGLHFVDENLDRAIAWREGKQAFRVSRLNDHAVETPIQPTSIP
jgi:dipeptidase E|uniref:Type 1 glutamine amidotransferase-like domain-containing protein n=1 Tax=Cephaloticoccus sp. TaxID=1985742 RepID=UPI00404A60A1